MGDGWKRMGNANGVRRVWQMLGRGAGERKLGKWEMGDKEGGKK